MGWFRLQEERCKQDERHRKEQRVLPRQAPTVASEYGKGEDGYGWMWTEPWTDSWKSRSEARL